MSNRRNRAAAVLVFLVLVLLTACTITSFTGTTSVIPGGTASYDIAVVGSGYSGTVRELMIVPADWTVASATYSGTANGSPVSGSATVTDGALDPCSVAIPAGYKGVLFQAGPFTASSTFGADSGTLHVDYTAGATTGTFTLMAYDRSVRSSDSSLNCTGSNSLQVTVSDVAKAFTPSTIPSGGVSTLSVAITNGTASSRTDVAFTDTYPAGLVNAPVSNASSSCGGAVTATPGTGSLQFTGGIIAPGATCVISADVTSSTPGMLTNTIPAGSITSSAPPNGIAASATLTVMQPPMVGKLFDPPVIMQGGDSALTIILFGSGPVATGVAFTDTFPAGMTLSATPNVQNSCGGTVTTTSTSIQLANGTLSSLTPCSITVNVTPTGTGAYVNTIPAGAVTASSGSNLEPASATLTVFTDQSIAKDFAPPTIEAGDESTLTITVTNTSASTTATAVAFTDVLPAGLTLTATPATNGCGGTLTTTLDTLQLSGGSIPPLGTCTVTAGVTATQKGTYYNEIPAGALTTSEGTNSSAGSAFLTVTTSPSVTKSFAPSTIRAGGIATLTLTLSNPDPEPSTNVTVSDLLPAGLVIAAVPNVINSCGGNVVMIENAFGVQLGTIPANGTCSVSIDVTAPAAGVYENVIPPSGLSSSTGQNVEPATATLTVVDPPIVSKAIAPDAIPAGGVATVTLTLSNPRGDASNDVALVDALPSGMTLAAVPDVTNTCGGSLNTTPTSLELTGGSIPASASCTISFDVTAIAPGTLVNTIDSGDLTSSTGGNLEPASAQLTVHAPPAITKSFAPDAIALGGTSTLTLTLSNPNPVAATDATFVDTFPSELTIAAAPNVANSCGGAVATDAAGITLTGGTIPAGSVCTITVDITSSTPGTWTNTIAAGGITTSTGASDAAASASLTVLAPPTLAKAFSPATIAVGGESTLTVTLSNSNAVDAIGVAFTDTFPAGVLTAGTPATSTTCGGTVLASTTTLELIGGTIPAGGLCTVVVNVTSDTPGTHTNTIPAGALASSAGTHVSDASAQLTVTAAPAITKSFAPDAIAIGGTSTLTLTLSNPNPFDATAAAFVDTLPSEVTIAAAPNVANGCGGAVTTGAGSVALTGGTIPAGSSCTITVDVTSSTPGTWTNTIAAAGLTTSVGASDAAASALLTVFASPSLAKTFAPGTIAVGGTSTLTVTLTNPNASAATGAAFTDTFPAGLVTAAVPAASGTCGGTVTTTATTLQLTGGTVPAGGACTVTVNVTSDTPDTYTNTIAAGGLSSSAGTNASDASAQLTVSARPAIGKAFVPAAIPSGGTATLTLTLSNPNPFDAAAAAFVDTLPAEIGLAATPNVTNGCGGSLTTGAGSIALTGGTIPANSACTITVDVTSSTPGTWANTIAAGGLTTSAGTSDTAASASLTVYAPPSLAKTFAPATIALGATSTLTVTLTNPNAIAATGAAFTDTFPAGLLAAATPAASTTCGGTVVATATTLQLTGGTIPAGGMCAVTVNVTSDTPGTHTNTIAAGALSSSVGTTASEATADLTVSAAPAIAKSFAPVAIPLGGTSTLTLTLSNPNPAPATAASFTDALPSEVVIAATPNLANGCGGTVTLAGGSVALSGGVIPASGSCTIVVDVTSATAGTWTNTIAAGDLTTSAGSSDVAATADLTVLAAPSVAKSFSPESIAAGSTATLTITLTNPNDIAATGVAVSDSLPSTLSIAAAPAAATACGGTVTTDASGIHLTGGTIPANGACSVTVDVTSTTPGTHTNTIPAGALTSSAGTNADETTATLTVLGALTVTKTFSPATIAPDATTTLIITITNPGVAAANDLAFIDTYPTGLVNAAAPGASSTCGGIVTAEPGASSLALSGGSVPAASQCTVSVTVTATAFGTYVNTLEPGSVTAANAESNVVPGEATLTAQAVLAAVPALDPRMLVALATLLACIGALMMRRV